MEILSELCENWDLGVFGYVAKNDIGLMIRAKGGLQTGSKHIEKWEYAWIEMKFGILGFSNMGNSNLIMVL
jgi:hypothetical protein